MRAKWMDDIYSRVRRISPQRAVAHSRLSVLGVMPIALCLAFWPFGALRGQRVTMKSAGRVPAAQGTVTVKNTKNRNEEVDVKVKALAKPSSLTPPENAYVVWIQPAGHPAQNMGELNVGSNLHGELKTQTPYKRFQVFITAQQNAQSQTPQGEQVLTASVAGQ